MEPNVVNTNDEDDERFKNFMKQQKQRFPDWTPEAEKLRQDKIDFWSTQPLLSEFYSQAEVCRALAYITLCPSYNPYFDYTKTMQQWVTYYKTTHVRSTRNKLEAHLFNVIEEVKAKGLDMLLANYSGKR
jgi:hypothetical protein